MGKIYVGIDVGSKGFISVQKEGVWEFISISDNSLKDICTFLSGKRWEGIACVIEDVHAIYGSSASATFSFGFNKGYLIGILTAMNIPYTLVSPKDWQGEMWVNADKIFKYGKVNKKTGKAVKNIDTKPTSINAARRLFPSLDLRRTPSCKKPDDNKCDSILMCEYARRKNL